MRHGYRVLAGCLWAVTAAAAQGPRLGDVALSGTTVPRYGRLELSPAVTARFTNPYDPEQVAVDAEFAAPSGRVLTVPGFWTRPYRGTEIGPADARRKVALLKLFIERRGAWSKLAAVDLFVDDLALREAGTGRFVPLDSGEAATTGWGPARWVKRSTELPHSGQTSLHFHTETGGTEDWPGLVLPLNGADWSRYDGLSFWVFPRVAQPLGQIRLYFNDGAGGNSPIQSWQVGTAELRPNQWNQLTWDWRGFPGRVTWAEAGAAGWRVRFCPTETGDWTGVVRVRDRDGTATSRPVRFRCEPSPSKGFVRVSREDPHYFDFDDGTAFVPIGHDVAWGVADVLTLFGRLHAAGENATYFIMTAADTAIEWAHLGEYDQLAAARLDMVMDAAERHDIYVKLSFDIHDALRVSGQWARNPYAAQRGGPCASVNEFYTSAAARRLYQRRLRYIAARWGWSPHLMAWEPVAEIDGGLELDGQAAWGYPKRPNGAAVTRLLTRFLKETHAYLRSVCPYQRLFTNSFGGDSSDPAIQGLPEVEYAQLHHYDSTDLGRSMTEWCRTLTRENAKPLMVTEFGWWADWTKPFLDREGVCQHNGIWASLMGGAAGAALSWWWEHIDEWNLYPHYLALRRFVDGVDSPRQRFQPAQAVGHVPPGGPAGPLAIAGRGPFSGAKVTEFTIAPDGTVNNPDQVPGYLLAAGRPETAVRPVFRVDYPQEGSFGVFVDSVSPDAELTIRVDGQVALRQPLPAENVPGKLSVYSEQYKVWRCSYDELVTIRVPAGRHEIRLENSKPGFSWIRTTQFLLQGYTPPTLRAIGLQGPQLVLLWLQNSQHTWHNVIQKLTVPVIRDGTVTISGLRDGAWSVEWWDTYQGRPTSRAEATARDGQVTLTVPLLATDTACKLRPH